MSKLVSKLLNGASVSDNGDGPPATHHFILRPNLQNSDVTDARPIDQPPESPAIYTIMNGKSNKQFYRGEPHPANAIGNCESVKMGLAMEIAHRGQPITVRTSASSTKYIVQSPNYGRLEWKPHPVTRTGLYLHDAAGRKVAAFKSNGVMNLKQKQLLVFIPCDGYYLEMVLMTALAAKALDKTVEEIALEAVGAV
jgi:hypothetical protein